MNQMNQKVADKLSKMIKKAADYHHDGKEDWGIHVMHLLWEEFCAYHNRR